MNQKRNIPNYWNIQPIKLQPITTNREDEKPMTKEERFNFLSFTAIIGSILVVYLLAVDSHFRSMILGTGLQLSFNSGMIIVIIVLLCVVLFYRKKVPPTKPCPKQTKLEVK